MREHVLDEYLHMHEAAITDACVWIWVWSSSGSCSTSVLFAQVQSHHPIAAFTFFSSKLQLNWIICPFKSDSSHSFFSAFYIDQRLVWSFIASLLIAFLHFSSFHVNIWPGAHWDCFMEGLIRWESKSICQVMFDRLITGGSIKKQSELRWLTRQLKPLCKDLGSHPSVRPPFPSRGLRKSSIIRNFILFLNVGYVLFCKPQKWSEFGRRRLQSERAQLLLSSTIIVFHWFGRKRVTGCV